MYRNWLIVALVLAFAALASACDILEQACPEGYWRPRAGEACVPVPYTNQDSGVRVDAGGQTDSGTVDASTPADAGATDGGATDGGAADGGATDGGATDGGATDGGDDAAVPDAGP